MGLSCWWSPTIPSDLHFWWTPTPLPKSLLVNPECDEPGCFVPAIVRLRNDSSWAHRRPLVGWECLRCSRVCFDLPSIFGNSFCVVWWFLTCFTSIWQGQINGTTQIFLDKQIDEEKQYVGYFWKNIGSSKCLNYRPWGYNRKFATDSDPVNFKSF